MLGVLLLHAPEVGVVVGGDDPGHVEFRHCKAVLRKSRIDPLPQCLGKCHEVRVDLQDADVILLNSLGQIAFHLGHDHGPEKAPAVPDTPEFLLPQFSGGFHDFDGLRYVAILLSHDHGPEEALAVVGAQKLRPPQSPGSPHHLQKELSGVRHPDVELTAGPQLHMEAGSRIEQPNL